MNAVVEILGDKLVGATMYHKSEENIRQKDYIRILADFSKLKSFWSKACFLVFLSLHTKNKSVKAISGKITRKLKTQDGAVFHRHIEPFISEINRQAFTDSTGKILANKLVDKLMEYGNEEFVILSRVVYSAGYSWGYNIKGVSLTKEDLERTKESY